MSRPRKQVVDYFPHICIHKKTVFILEQKYKNDGYAFWFKLLEMLGSTEGHYLDLNDITVWEFLKAKTIVDENSCTEMLDLLAKLEAIDKDLWQDKIVWSQNFVDGISEVYKNRRVEIPVKPSFYSQKPQHIEITTPRKPQSKGEESKGEESKVNIYVAEEIDYEGIKNYYHKICFKLPKIREINETRKTNIKKRIEQYGKEALVTVIKNTAASDFLSGVSTDWKANFDWMIKKENFIKILEGNYVNNAKPNTQGIKREVEKPDWLEQHKQHKPKPMEEQSPEELRKQLENMGIGVKK